MTTRSAPDDDQAATWLVRPSAPTHDTAFVMRVEKGPDAGRSLVLDASGPMRALVGTSPSCQLRLEDRQVSRRHLALEAAGAELRLTDLGSTNGTRVGALRVLEALLAGGEEVSLGETTLRLERLEGPRAQAPALPPLLHFGGVIGMSREMRRLHPLCSRLAKSDITVLIEGETGTGKEELARALHSQGARAGGPFVVFDCAAVPASLVESELFGHERGAFTGAVASRQGVFEQAHGGTLFIDEIGDLDLALQPKLLRAVERGEVRPLGGTRTAQIDVRLLSATRRNLDHEVEQERFRDDLFHRLAVARIELPPLRQRQGDLRMLAAHFCAHFGADPDAIPERVLAGWESWSWPGNVRELRNAVERQIALGDLAEEYSTRTPRAHATTARSDVFEQVLAKRLPLAEARQQVVEAFEARYLEEVLAQHGGNVTRAAEASGIARRHFYRLRRRDTEPRGGE
jgi:transcriptional regulator with GAF, ATPase, and Fis domain